jgi:hypothetical protein
MTASLADGQEALLFAERVSRVFEKPLLLREASSIIWGIISQASRGPRSTGPPPGEQLLE